MKKIAVFAVAVMMCLGMMAQAESAPMVRIGGGLIFDNTVWGATGNIDIPLGDESPIGINAFVDFHRKSGANSIPVGANITLSPSSEGSAKFSLGVGGGIVKWTGTTSFLINGTAIVDFPLNDQMNLFGQARYLYSKKSGLTLLNDVSAHVGISFSFGE